MPENDESDRPITHILYVRGREMRLHQELVLGHRRRPRAPRARPRRRRSGTSTRATPRSCSPSGPASSWRPGRPLDDAFDRGPARQRVHDPHPGLGRQRALRRGPRPAGRRPARSSGPAACPVERVLELGLGVDDDRGQFDMTAFSLRLTRGANARQPAPRRDRQRAPGRASSTTRSSASPTASTPRPGSAQPIARAARAHLGADLDDLDARPSGGRFWERLDRIPARRAVGGPPAPEARARASSRGAGCAASSRATASRRRSLARARGRARPDDPDDRLRPPVRDLQAGRPPVHRHRAPGARCCGDDGAAGPDRLRRQGPPRRPARPAA